MEWKGKALSLAPWHPRGAQAQLKGGVHGLGGGGGAGKERAVLGELGAGVAHGARELVRGLRLAGQPLVHLVHVFVV